MERCGTADVFSFLGIVILSDRVIFTLPGVSHEHPIKTLIREILVKERRIIYAFYTH